MDTNSAIDCKQEYTLIAIGRCVVCDVPYEPGATIKTTDVGHRNYLVDVTGFAKDVTEYQGTFDDTPVVEVTPAAKDQDSSAEADTKPARSMTRTRR